MPTCVALGETMALLTRDQLITEVGGPTKAAELCPDRTTGGINYTILDAAIDDAIGDVDAACAKFYADLSTNPPQKLTRIARQLGAYYLWLKAAAGKTMPENVSKAFGVAKQDLRDIEASDSLPGRDATYRFPSQIDNSYGGRRAVYSTFRRSGLLGSR